MSIAEVEKLAFALPETDRAELAKRLLQSLPPSFDEDDDEAIAEARRRDAELDANPELAMSQEQMNEAIGRLLRNAD